jgi:plasmid maintenance system antidote protein VapI
MDNKPTLAAVLRQAIRASGQSQNAISYATQVPAPAISRFLNGRRDLTLSTADKLAAHLGLELRPRKRTNSRKEGAP